MTDLAALLLPQVPDAVIFAVKDGVIRFWNNAAARTFGFSAEEALGRSLDLIIPEEFRQAHWNGFRRALADGRTKYIGQALPTRAQRKDDSAIYVELTFAIVFEGGAQVGALAHARNITERWTREREQRRRLRELEARLGAAGES